MLQGLLPALSFAERISPELNAFSSVQGGSQQGVSQNNITTPKSASNGYLQMQVATPTADEDNSIPVLKGSVQEDKNFVPDVDYSHSFTIPKGDKLQLIIMDMVATGYSEQGDQFDARVKDAVVRDGKILIPAGALVKGHVEKIAEPGKAFDRSGKMVLSFDYILMPDGRKVAFDSEYKKGDSTLKAVGRAVVGGIGGTLVGAVKGVIVGLKFGGLAGVALTPGATLVGGGGLGAIFGLGQGLAQSGDQVYLKEGDEIQVALEKSLNLPVVNVPPDTQNEIHANGLHVQVVGYSLGRDPFKVENQINLKLKIDNETQYTFNSMDLALVDQYNNTYSLSPFGDDSMFIFQIPPDTKYSGDATFSVKSPEVRHYLVFYKPYTREILAKISLTEALKNLSNQNATNLVSHQANNS